MMTKRNEAATQLWEQFFATMAKGEGAALMDPDYNVAEDEARLREGLRRAGWSEQEVQLRIDVHYKQVAEAPVTSPGVNPHVEFLFNRLSEDVEEAMNRLHLDSHARVARGVEPRAGPTAAMTNVVMTEESIVTVGAFLFRFCGAVARAFTRTLHLAPEIWDSVSYSEETARAHLRAAPHLMLYWLQIFVSFGITGTHILVPFRPANRYEVILFEQVARAMEIFAIAHEYGHHHLSHRQIGDDPKLQEYSADQFALKIGYEVERKPLLLPNPYLASGSGGIILLKAVQILRHVGRFIKQERMKSNDTHPDVASRLARFDSVALLKPQEFEVLKNFRTASTRIIDVAETSVSELVRAMPKEALDRLRTLSHSLD